jgi:hypothetical protein
MGRRPGRKPDPGPPGVSSRCKIENFKDSVTNNDSNTNIKIVDLTLGYSLRANGHIIITCE